MPAQVWSTSAHRNGTQAISCQGGRSTGKHTSPSRGDAPRPGKDAFNGARSASAGKTRDEIQDLYIAELRARGLEIPSEPFLAVAVDLLSGDARAGLGKIWKWVRRDLLRA